MLQIFEHHSIADLFMKEQLLYGMNSYRLGVMFQTLFDSSGTAVILVLRSFFENVINNDNRGNICNINNS